MRRALAFLTIFGGAAAPDDHMMTWFPVVGALIGGVVGSAWWAARRVWPPLVAGSLAVAVDIFVTGMLHFDGLADTADGLLPHMARERRLAVMREPTVGAYAVVVVGLVLLLRATALSSAGPNVGVIAAVWAASRTVMAVAARTVPYARAEQGLAAPMLGRGAGSVAGLGAVVAFGIGAAAARGCGVAAVAATFVGGALVVALARRRIGGFTGDVLGAAGVIAETVGLLVFAAR